MEHGSPKGEALEWRHYLQILARRKWIVIRLCIVGTVAGYLSPNLSAEQYEASALILVRASKNIESSQSGSKEVLNAPIGASQTETPGKNGPEGANLLRSRRALKTKAPFRVPARRTTCLWAAAIGTSLEERYYATHDQRPGPDT